MDANGFYPLVPLPPEHGALIPVTTNVTVIDADANSEPEPDFLALLWLGFCRLVLLLFLALEILHLLRLQLIELRQQAHFWRAALTRRPTPGPGSGRNATSPGGNP